MLRARFLALVAPLGVTLGCSGDATNNPFGNAGGASTVGPSSVGSGGAGATGAGPTSSSVGPASSSSVGPGGMGGIGGVGGSGGLGCSLDLHSVVDKNGNVVETCAPDEGCSDGMCIKACQAAADAKGNVGCDFVAATPYFYANIAPPCFAAFVANDWPEPAHLTISRAGTTYDVTTFGRIPNGTANASSWPTVPASGLPASTVAVLFLSHDPTSNNQTPTTCPVPPALDALGGSAVKETARGAAWHIQSDVPVNVYDILPYGGASSYLPSAEMLLPTSAWGKNHVAVLPKDSTGPAWAQIVAAEDGTTVNLVPNVALAAGTNVVAAPANQVTTYTLNAGEYVQWKHDVGMTGSKIESDKPISFTGGNNYICYSSATSTGGGCDSAHQQIPPVSAFGSEYVGAPYLTRRLDGLEESIPYRIVGTVAGTTLTFDPPVPGAPTTVGVGQKVDFEANVAFRVASQDADHPFYLGQMMTGCLLSVSPDGQNTGDEEFVNLLPPAQFLSRYAFFTDPTYTTTSLVFVRTKGPSGFAEVDLDCVGNVPGWTDIGTSGQYQIAKVTLVKQSVNQGACGNGAHSASSAAPFGVMVWGTATFASYAYPAGGRAAPINSVVVPAVP